MTDAATGAAAAPSATPAPAGPSAPPALEFRGVELGYGPQSVLRDLDLRLAAGEMLGVLGPNGSGKTTLVRGAFGLLAPRAGAALLQGRELCRIGRREAARAIAVVPQEGTPIFPFTVLETVLMGRAPRLTPFAFEGAEDLRAAEAALAAVDATGLAGRDLAELSGGERQRVIIARALAQEAPILLCDEPTAHLDLRHAAAIFALLRRLRDRRGLAVLAVTHDVNLAALYCDRLILLAGGTVIAAGPPREVLRADLLARAFGATVRVESRADGTPYVVPEREAEPAPAPPPPPSPPLLPPPDRLR
ncbi:MAG: ABC transporter ATP-binding protein [Planctomycetes bacterium]|nr:ABC transporter ATP-binding protein [Planctomycetota bacterium]